MSYAGDVTCLECWEVLGADQDAQLVDVRTFPEWNFVGLPDLRQVDKELLTVEWQQFPTMQVNPEFSTLVSNGLDKAEIGKDAAIYCLCRSGVRSIAAATALTQVGFTNAFNVVGGFEGDKNMHGHRATVSGWKFDGLPWVQG